MISNTIISERQFLKNIFKIWTFMKFPGSSNIQITINPFLLPLLLLLKKNPILFFQQFKWRKTHFYQIQFWLNSDFSTEKYKIFTDQNWKCWTNLHWNTSNSFSVKTEATIFFCGKIIEKFVFSINQKNITHNATLLTEMKGYIETPVTTVKLPRYRNNWLFNNWFNYNDSFGISYLPS